MNKKITYGILGLAVVAAGTYLTLSLNEDKAEANVQNKTETEYVTAVEKKEAERIANLVPIEVNDEMHLAAILFGSTLQKVNIGGEMYTPKGIDSDSIERTQLTKENIDFLKDALNTIEVSKNVEAKGYDYESILNRWSEGNFDKIIEETETLAAILFPSDDGKYHGHKITKKDYLEEQTYILNTFGDDAAALHTKQWGLPKQ